MAKLTLIFAKLIHDIEKTRQVQKVIHCRIVILKVGSDRIVVTL